MKKGDRVWVFDGRVVQEGIYEKKLEFCHSVIIKGKEKWEIESYMYTDIEKLMEGISNHIDFLSRELDRLEREEW